MSKKSLTAQRPTGQSGSGWYILSYAGNSIRKHKSRSLSLLLGVVIGVALVASVFVWTDTGTRVAIDGYFGENLFQFSISQRYEYPVDVQRIFDIKTWVDGQNVAESSSVVYHSIGLLGVTGMNNAHAYLPYPYSLNIKDTEVFFVNDTFLSAIRSKFDFNGTFAVDSGECLVSRRVIDDVRNVLNLSLTIGSTLDIAVAQVYADPSTIGDINRLNITGVVIRGIYDLPVSDSVLYNAFPAFSRPNYPASGYELVFGWNDGIIMATNQLNQSQLNTLTANGRANGRTFPKLLVRLDSEKVLAYGLDRVTGTIRGFKTQLEVAFQGKVDVVGERQAIYLEEYIQAYQSRQTLGVLVMPVIVLSVFLTTFATNIFLSGRRAEVAILRARGASFRQLYAAFLLEFVVIGVLAEFLGVFASLFVGCLIPSSSAFLQFDLAVFFEFFAVVRLQPYVWLIAGLACLVPPLVFTMIYVRSFLRTEIYQAMVGISPPGESDIGITILYFIGCLSLLALFFAAVIMLPATPSVAILQFIYAVAIWVLLSDSGSRVVRRGVAGVTKIFRIYRGDTAEPEAPFAGPLAQYERWRRFRRELLLVAPHQRLTQVVAVALLTSPRPPRRQLAAPPLEPSPGPAKRLGQRPAHAHDDSANEAGRAQEQRTDRAEAGGQAAAHQPTQLAAPRQQAATVRRLADQREQQPVARGQRHRPGGRLDVGRLHGAAAQPGPADDREQRRDGERQDSEQRHQPAGNRRATARQQVVHRVAAGREQRGVERVVGEDREQRQRRSEQQQVAGDLPRDLLRAARHQRTAPLRRHGPAPSRRRSLKTPVIRAP